MDRMILAGLAGPTKPAGLVLAALVAAVGCSSSGGGPTPRSVADDPLPKQAALGQTWALGDGMVTRSEYHTAVGRFRACMTAAGYRSTEPMLSPIDGLTLLYDLEPTGDTKTWNTTIERCNLTHLSHIEPVYIEKHDQVMVKPLREAATRCLKGHGVAPKGSERNVAEFLATVTDRKSQLVMDCVLNTARQLFPRLPHEVPIRT